MESAMTGFPAGDPLDHLQDIKRLYKSIW